MLFTEFNMEDALAVAKEEGEARGMKKLLTLWQKGLSLEQAKKRLKLS